MSDPLHHLHQSLRIESEGSDVTLQALIPSMHAELSQGELRCMELERTIDTLREHCELIQKFKSRSSDSQQLIAAKQALAEQLEATLVEIRCELVETKAKLSDFEAVKAKICVYEDQISDLTCQLHAFESKETVWLQDKADLEQKIQSLKLKEAVVRKAKLHYDNELSEKLVASHIEVRRLSEKAEFLSNQASISTCKRTKSLRLYSLRLICENCEEWRRCAFAVWKEKVRSQGNGRKHVALLRLKSTVKSGLLYAFLTWKISARAGGWMSDLQSSSRAMSVASVELDACSPDRDVCLTSNLFLSVLSLPPSQWGPAMNKLKVVQIIEEVFDRKYEVDLINIEEKVPLKSFSDCLSDYFVRKLGLPRLALKEIGVFLPGLSKLNREHFPLATLFCQIANVFAESPFPPEVGTFIIHSRAKFLQLVANQRKKGASKIKIETRIMKSRKADEANLPIIEMISLVSELFSTSRPYAERFLMLLKPDKVLHSEYVFFLICYDVMKQGTKVESLFSRLDSDRKTWLSPAEAAFGLQSYMKTWLNVADVEQALGTISPTKGKITVKDFAKALKIDQFPVLRNSSMFTISETEFLRRLGVLYMEMTRKNSLSIEETYARYCDSSEGLTGTALEQAIASVCTEETPPAVPCLALTQDQFLNYVLGNNLGNLRLGPFNLRIPESPLPILAALSKQRSATIDGRSPPYHKRSDSTVSSLV